MPWHGGTHKHLFLYWSCVQGWWLEIRTLLQNSHTLNHLKYTLFHSISHAVMIQQRNLGPMLLLTKICDTNWKEWNSLVYPGFLNRLPCWVILKYTLDHLLAMATICKTARKPCQLQWCVDEFTFILQPPGQYRDPQCTISQQCLWQIRLARRVWVTLLCTGATDWNFVSPSTSFGICVGDIGVTGVKLGVARTLTRGIVGTEIQPLQDHPGLALWGL